MFSSSHLVERKTALMPPLLGSLFWSPFSSGGLRMGQTPTRHLRHRRTVTCARPNIRCKSPDTGFKSPRLGLVSSQSIVLDDAIIPELFSRVDQPLSCSFDFTCDRLWNLLFSSLLKSSSDYLRFRLPVLLHFRFFPASSLFPTCHHCFFWHKKSSCNQRWKIIAHSVICLSEHSDSRLFYSHNLQNESAYT